MFDVFYIGTKPNLFPHERQVSSIEQAQQLSRTRYCWVVNYLLDYTDFDFLWEPVPWQNEFTHVWPSQWHDYSGTFLIPKTNEIKFHFQQQVIPTRNRPDEFKILTDNTEFDTTWTPHPLDPPYIYVFGNQWWTSEKYPTVEYHVPGATERKYIDYPQAKFLESNTGWTRLTEHKFTFDYSWRPDPGDPPYRYVFGNQWYNGEIMPTLEWLHPAADKSTPVKYVDWPRAKMLPNPELWTVPDGLEDFDLSWVPDPGAPPYIYQFGTQHQKTGGPVYTMPGATEINYVNYPRAKKVSIDPCWTIPEGIDTESFDWTWHPDATELPYIYQFATQHQKTGGAIYTVPGATEIKYLENIEVKIESGSVPIVEIDHMDGNAGQIPNTIKTIRYFDNYKDTLVRLAKNLKGKHEFVWVCSSICDYTGFDFTWHPEQWQQTMLHVFASNEQKFGDTFFMHVPTFAERAEKKALLEWYSVNFVPGKIVPRRRIPMIKHDRDTHVDVIKSTEFAGPLALFSVDDVPLTIPAVNLWRQETKTIMPLSPGASSVIVPKTAVTHIKTQLYDYPYIDKTQQQRSGDQPLDIVFIENGEPNAEHHWMMLGNRIINLESNRLHRVSNVKGRAAAYHAAARASTTPWFFAVFGKLAIDFSFDWEWQPDRMQEPKHYIFHARNPVNGLTYGHQAMIAYNKQLVLDNPGVGLDFTLDSPHEVVPIVSGTAYYADSKWSAWRTAFRECLKLCGQQDVESTYRLNRWLTKGAEHPNGEWSVYGAEDAVEYYEQVKGDFDALKKSYEWEWLASYAFMRRNLTTDQ